MRLHHLHHELASAQALCFPAGAQPGRSIVAPATRVGAHVRCAAEASDPVLLVAVELLPSATICNVPPMKEVTGILAGDLGQGYGPSADCRRRLPETHPRGLKT